MLIRRKGGTVKEFFENPKILLQPNIPKPLHGVNPRNIYGDEWWDTTRKVAYKKHNNHCYACGIHKSNAHYHNWLEAHEVYETNYKSFELVFVDVVALCHSCHNFIHSGRLFSLLNKGQVTSEKFEHIMRSGFFNVTRYNLKPAFDQAFAWCLYKGIPENDAINIIKGRGIDIPPPFNLATWNSWSMVIDGNRYTPIYKSIEEWTIFYFGKGEGNN